MFRKKRIAKLKSMSEPTNKWELMKALLVLSLPLGMKSLLLAVTASIPASTPFINSDDGSEWEKVKTLAIERLQEA